MANSKCIVVFGPGPQFKGGLANYTTSLAKAMDKLEDTDVHIISWTQQYPAIIPRDFIDRSSKTDLLEGTNIKVQYLTNYNNPFSWRHTYKVIKNLKPDMVIFQWSISIQGLPVGYMARMLMKHTNTEVIFDLHFVVQKEKSTIDRIFTKYGIRHAHTYVVHAYKTADELKSTFPSISFHVTEKGERVSGNERTVIKLYHPVYDMFAFDPSFDKDKFKKKMGLKKHVFLFFGFIRRYKGLHLVLEAFKHVQDKRDDVSLLIVGESFWQTLDQSKFSTKIKNVLFNIAKFIFLQGKEDERKYRPLEIIDKYEMQDTVKVVNDYVPNEDVGQYFQASDCIMLYYLTATPSGIESIAYNFNLPPLASRVGHFPETVKDGYNGYLAEPENIIDMANTMIKFLDEPISVEKVAESAAKMSWENYVKTILQAE